MRAALLILLALAVQESGRPVCECKPREVGPSGSRQDWKGYRKGIDWHHLQKLYSEGGAAASNE